jgi:hypothetical protein
VSDRLPGQIWFAIMFAGALSFAASAIIGALYRRALPRHMKGPGEDADATAPPAAREPALPGAGGARPVASRAGNRRAQWRLDAFVVGTCVLMAFSVALIELFVFDYAEPTPRRLVVQTTLNAWLAVPVLAMAWRWRRRTLVVALLCTFAAATLLVMLQSTAGQQLRTVSGGYAMTIGIPMLILFLFGFGGITRAVGPWLLPLFLVLTVASLLGFEALNYTLEHHPDVLRALTRYADATTVIALGILAPWILAALPLRWLARRIEALYRDKTLSELSWLMTSFWFVDLSILAAGALTDANIGLRALLLYAPLLWLPLAFRAARHVMAPPAPAPLLLVLRVFRRDREMEQLFDAVIDRWRLSGNVALIAATDLLSRTVDPCEIFGFLGGRLGSQFIATVAQVPARLQAFDLAPDIEGRFRVNECYCRDNTWQAALDALVARSDVVLTDLRGFSAANAGCRYELEVLTHAPHVRRVVVLYDGHTDRTTAAQDTAAAAADRFSWLDVSRLDAGTSRAVLGALLQAMEPRRLA